MAETGKDAGADRATAETPPRPAVAGGERSGPLAAFRSFAPAIVCLFFLPACVPPDPPEPAVAATAPTRYASYRCDDEGEITLENFRTSVHVVDGRGVDVELPAAPPDQTARYGQPGYALILEKGTALWMVAGKRPVNCKRENDPA
jgi:hypothetical protein